MNKQPAPLIQPAAPVEAAPPARRGRNPRGVISVSSGSYSSAAPTLLELVADMPMATVQRGSANYFVPDANLLFYVLSICDRMMGTIHRFQKSSPAWLPIVSQLYISVLWVYQIMRVYIHSGYGLEFAHLAQNIFDVVRLDECMIPGPLVPFFESLAAVNGPFEWIGDVTCALPGFSALWNASEWCPNANYLRSIPIPAVLLDQLAYFASYQIPSGQTCYDNFEWYRNIFSVPANNNTHPLSRHRINPACSGSLFTTEAQVNGARIFWNSALSGFPRTDVAEQPVFSHWAQLFGFMTQAGNANYNWLQIVNVVMHNYSQYFKGSKPLQSISPVGLGAVLVHARPNDNASVRDWLYPSPIPGPFLSSQFAPCHEIPPQLRLTFSHSDHDLEVVAEQYAIVCATNIRWSRNNETQHNWTVVDVDGTHVGDYWAMLTHRKATDVNISQQPYAQLIYRRYQQLPLK